MRNIKLCGMLLKLFIAAFGTEFRLLINTVLFTPWVYDWIKFITTTMKKIKVMTSSIKFLENFEFENLTISSGDFSGGKKRQAIQIPPSFPILTR